MLDVIHTRGQSVILVVLSVFDPAEVGSEGKGYRWKTSSLDDTEEDELAECIWGEMSSNQVTLKILSSFIHSCSKLGALFSSLRIFKICYTGLVYKCVHNSWPTDLTAFIV